jgi:phospholipase/carboxylesterase
MVVRSDLVVSLFLAALPGMLSLPQALVSAGARPRVPYRLVRRMRRLSYHISCLLAKLSATRSRVGAPPNEPNPSPALVAVPGVIERLDKGGILPEQSILPGFSQRAWLASEFTARNPERFGGVLMLGCGLGAKRDLSGLKYAPRQVPITP